MNQAQWIRGALNSAIKKAVDLGLVILAAYTIGGRLDPLTLIYAFSIGWITGIFVFAASNPLPDFSASPKVITLLPSVTLNKTDKIDKIDK